MVIGASLANNGTGPSKHLTWKELACKNGIAYPNRFILDGRVFKLAAVFEDIRGLWGKPITIHSAYRTPEYNKKIGGARASQHMQGRALDLAPPEGVTLNQFYDAIKANVNEFGIRGLGKYKTFVHVDIRPSDRLVVWFGSGSKDSQTA